MRVRVIGIGSPFADDQIGWRVAELLRQSATLHDYIDQQIEIVQTDRPGARLLQQMNGADSVILIDAMLQPQAAGEIQKLTVEETVRNTALVSSHGFGVQQALALGQAISELPKDVLVIGIEVSPLKCDNRLKEKENNLVDKAVAMVEEALLMYLKS